MTQMEIVKKLEHLVAFQTECLSRGDWESFDKVENEIKKLEKMIITKKENSSKLDVSQEK